MIEFDKNINYVNRDFNSIKRDLMEYTKAHHSGVFQDFNESSAGMALLELVAYVGDVLSYYQDKQFNELKETCVQIENVTSFAKRKGYHPSGKRAARGISSIFIEVPSTIAEGRYTPDDNYSPILQMGSKLQGPGGIIFETLSDVHFSASAPTEDTEIERMVTGSQFNNITGLPTYFAIRKDVPVIAGETNTDIVTIGSFEQFKTIELLKENVIEILSVVDSDGNNWTQVDYLPQEVVFDSVVNEEEDNNVVPYVMKFRTVPRRFVIDRDPITNKTSLIFGSGDGVNFDDELIPNLSDFALPISSEKKTFSSFSLDPQNFLKTSTLGLSPFNTTLTINYRVGGGKNTNVPPGSINIVNNALLSFTSTNLDVAKKSDVINSIECLNSKKTEGGADEETITDIKINSSAFFAAQDRVVTREDYVARTYSMPSRYGKVKKAFVRKDAVNTLGLNMHILSEDEVGNLSQATSTLIKNLKRYLTPYRMLTDAVNILYTDIINLRVKFGVVVNPKFNRNEVLAKCLNSVRNELDVANMEIGQPIVISELTKILQDVNGIVSVYSTSIKNVFGVIDNLSYFDNVNNSVRFDVDAWTQNGIVYCPENAIFQIKYPLKDIIGESK